MAPTATVASPSIMKSHLQDAKWPTPFIPDNIPAEINPAKALERGIPQIRSAILIPISRFVYQQLRKKIAPGKKGASTKPRNSRTINNPGVL
jgi:hypothetical protein